MVAHVPSGDFPVALHTDLDCVLQRGSVLQLLLGHWRQPSDASRHGGGAQRRMACVFRGDQLLFRGMHLLLSDTLDTLS